MEFNRADVAINVRAPALGNARRAPYATPTSCRPCDRKLINQGLSCATLQAFFAPRSDGSSVPSRRLNRRGALEHSIILMSCYATHRFGR